MQSKIAALLTVKDEVELIGFAIEHLRSIGVNLIIACDMNSTDGTAEVLQPYESSDFKIIRADDVNLDAQRYQEMLRSVVASAAAANADWLLVQDADEYWIPITGDLRDCTSLQSADLLVVDRFNVPLVQGEEMPQPPFAPKSYDHLLLIIKSVPNFREFMRDNPTAPWVLGVPVPKVMVRPTLITSFTQAGHDAIAIQGASLRRAKPIDLLVAHLPFTGATRFARKIANIRRNISAHDRDLTGDLAWHWRRWIALADEEGIDAEFQRSTFTPQAIHDLRCRGIIQTASEILGQRRVPA